MSIHNKALLVSLSIGSLPKTRKVDRVTDEVEERHRTAHRQASVITRLFAKEDVKYLDQVSQAARKRFREVTLPFGRSQGLIPSKKVFDFLREMGEYRAQFEDERKRIIDDIDRILSNACTVNGTLYEPENYPARNELAEAMFFAIDVNPVPAASAYDELTELSPEELEFLKNEAVITNQSKIESAVKDLFNRLLKTLKHASDRLSDEDLGGCKIFHNTVVTNIAKAIEAAETLNLNDDQELIELTEAVKEIIDNLTADDLRKDHELRRETAAKAAELAARIEELL